MKPLTLYGYFLPAVIPGMTKQQKEDAGFNEKKMEVHSFCGPVEVSVTNDLIWVEAPRDRIFIASASDPCKDTGADNLTMLNKWRGQ